MHLVMVSICGNLCIEIWGDVFNLEVSCGFNVERSHYQYMGICACDYITICI